MTKEEITALCQSAKNPSLETMQYYAQFHGEEHFARWLDYYVGKIDELVSVVSELSTIAENATVGVKKGTAAND